jgi:lipopolysaccharide/colanic/teichoic acid biosynthesis glycosyltransferase
MKYLITTRFFDILFSLLGLTLGFPLLLIVYLIIFFEGGSPLFYQKRVGRNKSPFTLIKFRTMHLGTPSVASHLVNHNTVTKIGAFLRKTKLDELPQLWNVLVGDMSLVGPRPCLFNQTILLNYREAAGIFKTRPGITGLAQIKNIDMSTPELLSTIDKKMINDLSIKKYFKYIFQTVAGKGRGDVVV